MNRLIVAFVVCLIISDLISATDRHLICKSMNDLFSSGDQVQSGRWQSPVLRGRTGKVGPRGIKGDRGDRGRDGIVDYSAVNDTVEEMVALATAKLQAKVERLENEIQNISDVFSKLDISTIQTKVETVETTTSKTTISHMEECTEGFRYRAKCYFMKLQSLSSRSHGAQICEESGGQISDIENLELETLAMNYVRALRRKGTWLWIGPKYEPSTGTVRLSDGRGLSSSTLRWHPGFPSTSSRSTGMRLVTKPDASDQKQGVYNREESAGGTHGVLCEKRI